MRYNALSWPRPNFVSIGPIGTGTQNPQSMLVNETTFWFARMKTMKLVGTLTKPGVSGSPFMLAQTLDVTHGDSSIVEDDLYKNVADFNIAGVGTPVNGQSPAFSGGLLGSYIFDPGSKGKTFFPAISFTIDGFSTSSSYGSLDSMFVLTITGSDEIANAFYNYNIPIYGNGSGFSGSCTITPLSFWPFNDAEGNPLYDSTTGAYANV